MTAPSRTVEAMTDYQPAWRRPIARVFRRTAHAAVRWCVRLGIHPNLVSYASIAASAAAGLCFWQAGAVPALLLTAGAFFPPPLWVEKLPGLGGRPPGAARPPRESAPQT